MKPIYKLSEIPENQRDNIIKLLGNHVATALTTCNENINRITMRYGIKINVVYQIEELDDNQIGGISNLEQTVSDMSQVNESDVTKQIAPSEDKTTETISEEVSSKRAKKTKRKTKK